MKRLELKNKDGSTFEFLASEVTGYVYRAPVRAQNEGEEFLEASITLQMESGVSRTFTGEVAESAALLLQDPSRDDP